MKEPVAKLRYPDLVALAVALYRRPENQETIMVLSSPGIGKTAAFRAIIAEIRKELPSYGAVEWSLLTEQPEDRKGLPRIEGGKTMWSVPGDFPAPGTRGAIFIDEVPSLPVEMQKITAQAVGEKRVGCWPVPDGWSFFLAGNRQSDKAGASKILEHLTGRTIKVTLISDIRDWAPWAKAEGLAEDVVSYLEEFPDQLERFDPSTPRADDEGFPSPRSWARLGRNVADVPPSLVNRVAAGIVGAEAAGAWLAWRSARKIPSLAGCLSLPARADTVPATAVMAWVPGLSAELVADNPAAWALLPHVPADIASQAVYTAVAKDRKKMQSSPAFAAWVLKCKVNGGKK